MGKWTIFLAAQQIPLSDTYRCSGKWQIPIPEVFLEWNNSRIGIVSVVAIEDQRSGCVGGDADHTEPKKSEK